MTDTASTATFDARTWMRGQQVLVEQALDRWVRADAQPIRRAPEELMAPMRYAVLEGGKRLRALLVLAAFEAVESGLDTGLPAQEEDADEAARRGAVTDVKPAASVGLPGRLARPPSPWGHVAALRAACSVELIHAYSLVHDDMPCMDNDVLRRGKPTVHVRFGEASALLAGDALQALAFELLTPQTTEVPAAQQALLCRLLARAAGATGMAGGQAIDLASVGRRLTEPQLREMHRLKTGALLQASVMMGAACSQTTGPMWSCLQEYGEALGLAFQVVDDVLDVTADSSVLGKTAGKDAECNKPTYVSLLGLAAARSLADSLRLQAQQALQRSGLRNVSALQALADRVVGRSH